MLWHSYQSPCSRGDDDVRKGLWVRCTTVLPCLEVARRSEQLAQWAPTIQYRVHEGFEETSQSFHGKTKHEQHPNETFPSLRTGTLLPLTTHYTELHVWLVRVVNRELDADIISVI